LNKLSISDLYDTDAPNTKTNNSMGRIQLGIISGNGHAHDHGRRENDQHDHLL